MAPKKSATVSPVPAMAEVEEKRPLVLQFRNRILEERKADGVSQDGMDLKNAALRNTYLSAIEVFVGDETYTGPDALREYFRGSNKKFPTGQTLSSRNTEWSNVRLAAIHNRKLLEAIWPSREDVAKVEGMKNTDKASFLRACTMIREDKAKALTVDQVRATMFKPTKKEVDDTFEVPEFDETTDGDLLATIVAAGTQLYKSHTSTFAEYQVELLALQARFNAGRAGGKYRTSAEIVKQPAAPAEMAAVEIKVAA